MNAEEKIKRILEDKPFSKLITIKEIIPFKKTWNQEAFRVIDVFGRSFKLRMCNTSAQAAEIESRVRLIPHVLPYFHGRDRNYLLFDFIEGTSAEGAQDLRTFYQMGKLCGEVGQFGKEGDKKEVETKCRGYLLSMKENGLITEQDVVRLFNKFRELHARVQYDVGLELVDIHPNNFVVDQQNVVYYVDDEGLSHTIQGTGFVAPFTGWFTPEQRKAFLEGYASAKNTAFFTKDFEKFITFYNLLRIISIRILRGTDYREHLQKLLSYH